MIHEAYVSFEIAKLLKEKGFDWKTQYVYTEDGTGSMPPKIGKWKAKSNIPKATHQMTCAWLREKGVYMSIDTVISSSGNIYFNIDTYSEDSGWNHPVDFYDSYEDAIEAAIEYSLENLI